jgi:hypothetical protein
MTNCSILNCNGKYKAKGYCDKHYKRFKKYNDPLKTEWKNQFTDSSVKNYISNRICKIEGCGGKIRGRGYCLKHHKKLIKYGNPLERKINRDYVHGTPKEKFIKSYQLNENGCWIWTAIINKNGYGIICIKRKRILAHRFSYEFHVKKIPEGMIICHRCDNPGCVNPNHLFIGTHADNIKDKLQKGRGDCPKGEKCVRAKLTNEKVLQIREMIKDGIFNILIAEKFGVHPNTILAIKKGKAWRHV